MPTRRRRRAPSPTDLMEENLDQVYPVCQEDAVTQTEVTPTGGPMELIEPEEPVEPAKVTDQPSVSPNPEAEPPQSLKPQRPPRRPKPLKPRNIPKFSPYKR